MISEGKLSPLVHNVSSLAKDTAKNLMVMETVEGYASLPENLLKFPSEVAFPKAVTEIPPKLKEEWKWNLFSASAHSTYANRTLRSLRFLDKLEEQWSQSQTGGSGSVIAIDEALLHVFLIWVEQQHVLSIVYVDWDLTLFTTRHVDCPFRLMWQWLFQFLFS